MLNLIGKALTGVVLDREAREAMREAGGLASAIQSSADARMIKAAMAAQGLQLVGSTPLTSPRIASPSNPLPLAVRIARAAITPANATPSMTSNTMGGAATGQSIGASTLAAQEFEPESAPLPAPTPTEDDRIVPLPSLAPKPARPPAPKKRAPVSAERAALIEEAMKLHTAKQSVLAHLSDDQRALLTSIAMKALFPQTTG
jgi:hypothetical protein